MKQLVQAQKGRGYSLSDQGVYVAYCPHVVVKTAQVSTGIHYNQLELIVDELPDDFDAEAFQTRYKKNPELAIAHAKQNKGKKSEKEQGELDLKVKPKKKAKAQKTKVKIDSVVKQDFPIALQDEVKD